MALTGLASMGETGGMTGSCTRPVSLPCGDAAAGDALVAPQRSPTAGEGDCAKRGPHRRRQAEARRYRCAAMTKSPIWPKLGRRIFLVWKRHDVGDVITADDPLITN